MSASKLTESPEPEDTPEALFAAWLDAGGDEGLQGFEALCAAHPESRESLQRLHRLWRELGSVRMRMRGAGSIAARLTKQFGQEVNPHVSLDVEGHESWAGDEAPKAVIERLVEREHPVSRYLIQAKIAEGGMGEVLRVWDGDLRRKLAMKVMLGKLEGGPDSMAKSVSPGNLKRFLEEAQITGQLDHPGIVPVHELGLDSRGRLYFTMKLVKGRDLAEIFELVREGREGWSTVRALNVLLRVCEAMSYAHAKGVIHRDLKPPNIMVGRFGEVYVMDWGLAKVLGEAEGRDIRIRRPDEGMLSRILRLDAEDDGPDSPLVTMDGDVVGTPSYMPPEQAAGRLDDMGPHSDVYAMGAMIYHLLVGHMPFVPPGVRVRAFAILMRVQESAPRAVHELAPEAPAELVAICEKAMAREPSERYADISKLGADLSAYLEGRVVHAYETGAWAEGRKWVRRNRALAGSLAAVLVLALGSSITVGVVQAQGKHRAEQAQDRAERERANAVASEQRARKSEQSALESEQRALSLSDAELLDDLRKKSDRLWPAVPAMLAQLREFGDSGIDVFDRLDEHRAHLNELRSRALASEGTQDPSNLSFKTPQEGWMHTKLNELVVDLEKLTDAERGLLGTGLANEFGWGIGRRISFAEELEHRSITSPEAQAAWDEAIESIRDSERYGGLEVQPQLGLLPIGEDPWSGLHQFAHLASGEVAEVDADGFVVPTDSMGVVLVLIPPGFVRYGAQGEDRNGPNYDRHLFSNEAPVGGVNLDAFFISKYELTQAQWVRIMGANPSLYHLDNWADDWFPDASAEGLLLPVENTTWEACAQVLMRLDLEFPTEVQWEAAARAGTQTPYPFGETALSLEHKANILDEYASRIGFELEEGHYMKLDDRAGTLAPVGWYEPNAYGLHDVIGNVQEYCLDCYSLYGNLAARDGDGLRGGIDDSEDRVVRGGSYLSSERRSRVSGRGPQEQSVRNEAYGLRPARSLRRD